MPSIELKRHHSLEVIDGFDSVIDLQDTQSALLADTPVGIIDHIVQTLRPRQASKRSLLLVFRQLALLVETGIDVAESIELVAHSCHNKTLKRSLLLVYEDIRNGSSFSMAVAGQEQVLGCDVAASIQAGEASGRLVGVLRQIEAQLEENLEVKSAIVSALAYPTILSAASLVVAGILVWFVLPQFELSFTSMAVEPPLVTACLFALANFARAHVWLLAIGSGLIAIAIVTITRQNATRNLLDRILFQSPVIGRSLRSLAVGQLFLNLGHLLSNGISLLEAIQLANRSVSSYAIKRLVQAWEQDVIEGRGLSYSLNQFDFLPDGADAMLIMAEKSGRLESVLTTAGSFYRKSGSSQLRQLLKLSEPVIIIMLGIFVGLVVASVLLPILDVQAGAS